MAAMRRRAWRVSGISVCGKAVQMRRVPWLRSRDTSDKARRELRRLGTVLHLFCQDLDASAGTALAVLAKDHGEFAKISARAE